MTSPDPLASLRVDLDELVQSMQTTVHRRSVEALFASTPEELGQAAVRATTDQTPAVAPPSGRES